MAEFQRISGSAPQDGAVVVEISSAGGDAVARVRPPSGAGAELLPVPRALAEAGALAERLGLDRVLVRLADERLWQQQWGTLTPDEAREPIGNIERAELSDDEAFDLAQGIERERDA